MQIWSRPKWSQVIASQRKCMHARPGQTVSQVDPSFQLASPFDQGLMHKIKISSDDDTKARDSIIMFRSKRIQWNICHILCNHTHLLWQLRTIFRILERETKRKYGSTLTKFMLWNYGATLERFCSKYQETTYVVKCHFNVAGIQGLTSFISPDQLVELAKPSIHINSIVKILMKKRWKKAD